MKSRLARFFRRKPRNQRGQGATEYILLLVVIVAVLYAFKDKIKSVVSGKVDQVGSQINEFNGD
ncbi:MAG: hypothetical protein COT74_05455 [Bdellovibrionales bacterium CG10_big_fil_rev_8_21_14_0_10_45_34]|nr:MAG: hypothetical protein COT74_05455 [Bdellovibrionales bacterium CG10_big_fil_rev_8_21_14_0_10_45_34]